MGVLAGNGSTTSDLKLSTQIVIALFQTISADKQHMAQTEVESGFEKCLKLDATPVVHVPLRTIYYATTSPASTAITLTFGR